MGPLLPQTKPEHSEEESWGKTHGCRRGDQQCWLASWFSANPGVAASISSEHRNISNPDCGHLMLSPGGTNSASTLTPPRKPWVGQAHRTSPGLRESLGLPEGPEGSRALPASAPAWPPRGRCKPGRAPPGTGRAPRPHQPPRTFTGRPPRQCVTALTRMPGSHAAHLLSASPRP